MYGLDRASFEIDIDTAELIAILQRNADEHQRMYDQAKKLYRSKAEELLQDRLVVFYNDDPTADLRFDLHPPKCHINDYKMALEMVSRHRGSTFRLSSPAYRALVLDKWEWSSTFYDSVGKISPALILGYRQVGE